MAYHTYLLILAGLLGLVLGSFLNVVIYRLPRSQSLGGRSCCPQCKKQLHWYHNIPVASYLVLGGQCGFCHQKISTQYPLVEIFTAFLSMLTIARSDFDLASYLLWFLLFVCPLIAIIFIDWRHHIIPDSISLPGIPIGFLAMLWHFWPDWRSALLDSGIGFVVGGGSLLTIAWVYEKLRKKEGLGGGDVKLCAMLGAWTGWQGILFIFFVGSVLGSLYVVGLYFTQAKTRASTEIAFGPFLASAALVYFLKGPELIQIYLHTF